MGSSAPKAPKPDPKIAKALQAQVNLGNDYLSFAKEQFAVSQERQKSIDALTTEISTYFLDIAKEDRARYDTTFKPLEDQFVKTAQEFDSPERQAEAAAKAKATVQSAAAVERGASDRNLASVGVKPDSGRYAGLDRAFGLGTELTSVNAQNAARNEVRDKGLALKGAAIDLGRGISASGTAAAGSASQPSLAANAQWQATPGIVQPGYASAQQGYVNQATGLTNLYSTQADIYNTQAKLASANAAGIGSFAGTVAGAAGSVLSSPTGLMLLSSKKAKENRKKVPEGKALKAVKDMPVESYNYKPGMGDGGAQEHVGPMAEDYQKATGGGDGKTIPMQDMLGVTMKAVQDLSAKVDRMAEAIGLGDQQPAAA